MREFRFATPEEAEAAFYGAFASRSLEEMMQVWAADDTVVCIHPMGPRLTGSAAIAASWRQIFGGGGEMQVKPGGVVVTAGASLVLHSVDEHILLGDGRRGLVHATNVYRLTADGWRMVMHHGSPGGAREGGAGDAEGPPVVH